MTDCTLLADCMARLAAVEAEREALVTVVREWQEARKAWKEARREARQNQEGEPVAEWQAYLTAESALAALSTLALPEDKE